MSSFPTVEVTYGTASEALLGSPNRRDLFEKAGSILKEQNGLIKTYYGIQHEDKSTFYLIIPWKSPELHQELMSNTTTYGVLGEALAPLFDSGLSALKMFHVKTTNDPSKAFEAPVLELATFTLPEGKSISESRLESLVEKLTNAIMAREGAGAIQTSWGPVVEMQNQLMLFIGWTSVEAHWSLVKGDSEIEGLIEEIRGICTVGVQHVPLDSYQ